MVSVLNNRLKARLIYDCSYKQSQVRLSMDYRKSPFPQFWSVDRYYDYFRTVPISGLSSGQCNSDRQRKDFSWTIEQDNRIVKHLTLSDLTDTGRLDLEHLIQVATVISSEPLHFVTEHTHSRGWL